MREAPWDALTLRLSGWRCSAVAARLGYLPLRPARQRAGIRLRGRRGGTEWIRCRHAPLYAETCRRPRLPRSARWRGSRREDNTGRCRNRDAGKLPAWCCVSSSGVQKAETPDAGPGVPWGGAWGWRRCGSGTQAARPADVERSQQQRQSGERISHGLGDRRTKSAAWFAAGSDA